MCTLAATRFRFQEKGAPQDYAVSIAELMALPIPKELLLSGPRLVWEWDEGGLAEREVMDMLQSLRADKGRVFLMSRQEQFKKLNGENDEAWQSEPWYGTTFQVKKFDEDFLRQVCHHHSHQLLTYSVIRAG